MTSLEIDLLNTFDNDTPFFTLKGYITNAKCVSAYDGDTIHVIFKHPLAFEYHKWSVRLIGIDAPEIKTNNAVEKEHALNARNYLREQILDKVVRLECGEFDKYGRLLAVVYKDDININQEMIQRGFGYSYDGGKKQNVHNT